MKVNEFEGIGDPVELYYTFKDIFFSYIDNNIVEKDLSDIIIKAYNSYHFNKVRLVIDDEVADRADICMINNIHNILDEVDNTSYKAWKEVQNMFSLFEETYSELLTINIQ